MPRMKQQIAEVAELYPDTIDESLALAFEEDVGTGLEEAEQEDFALPFLAILQPLSPQVTQGHGKYIEGAAAGMIMNTVTGELYDIRDGETTLWVVPCHFRLNYVEWIPRKDGGGFIGSYDRNEGRELAKTCVENDKGRKVQLPNGHELIDTRNHFVLIVKEDGETEPAMIAMKSTQASVSRTWMAQVQMFKAKIRDPEGKVIRTVAPKSYGQIWPLTTYLETKDNYTWWKWKVGTGRVVPSVALFDEGKAFHNAVLGGQVKIDQSQEDITSAESDAYVETEEF